MTWLWVGLALLAGLAIGAAVVVAIIRRATDLAVWRSLW